MLNRSKSLKERRSSKGGNELQKNMHWTLERQIVLFNSMIECNGKDMKDVVKKVNDLHRSYPSCDCLGFKMFTLTVRCPIKFSPKVKKNNVFFIS